MNSLEELIVCLLCCCVLYFLFNILSFLLLLFSISTFYMPMRVFASDVAAIVLKLTIFWSKNGNTMLDHRNYCFIFILFSCWVLLVTVDAD